MAAIGLRSSIAAGSSIARRRRGPLGFLVREGSAVLLAAALLYVFWGGYRPALESSDAAMWHVFGAAAVLMLYVLLQAIAAVTHPLRRETGPLIDVLVSLLPLLVVGYTIIEWLRQGLTPTTFQLIVFLLSAAAISIDIIVFTWFSMRVAKLAQEVIPTD